MEKEKIKRYISVLARVEKEGKEEDEENIWEVRKNKNKNEE